MKKEKINEAIVSNLKELMSTKSLFVQTFGQIEIKRRELKRQINELDQIELEANNSYKVVEDQIYSITKELEKKYPNGSLDLITGIMTYKD
jgi:cell shape-determining protein MreC